MIERPTIAARAVPCPVCGYDLRATARGEGGARCPECGMVSRELAASRIPWVQRRQIGRIKAYWRTIWMVLRRPGELAREVEGRLRRRDAVRFELVSRILATVVGTALVGVAFGIAPMMPITWWMIEAIPAWIMPWVATWDAWWALVGVAAGIYLALWMMIGVYRWIYCLGEQGMMRRRMGRVSSYVSALMPFEVILSGLVLVVLGMTHWESGVMKQMSIPCAAMALIGLWLFLWVTLAMVVAAERAKGLRGTLMVVAYPVVAAVIFAGTILSVMWVAGYAAMAVRSMTR